MSILSAISFSIQSTAYNQTGGKEHHALTNEMNQLMKKMDANQANISEFKGTSEESGYLARQEKLNDQLVDLRERVTEHDEKGHEHSSKPRLRSKYSFMLPTAGYTEIKSDVNVIREHDKIMADINGTSNSWVSSNNNDWADNYHHHHHA